MKNAKEMEKLFELSQHFGKYEIKDIMCVENGEKAIYLTHIRYDVENHTTMVGGYDIHLGEVEVAITDLEMPAHVLSAIIAEMEKECEMKSIVFDMD